jgi:hypothetical protein
MHIKLSIVQCLMAHCLTFATYPLKISWIETRGGLGLKFLQIKTLKTKFLSFHKLEQGRGPFHYLMLSQLKQHKTFDHGLRFMLSSSHKLQQGGPSHYRRFSQIGTTHTHKTWLGFHKSQQRGGCFSLPWARSHIKTTQIHKLNQALTNRNKGEDIFTTSSFHEFEQHESNS